MSAATHTPCPRFLVMAGADPKDKGIHDSQWGHYGVTFAIVSFAHEYSHLPELITPTTAEYAERVAAALNACEGIPVEVLKANAAGGLPYSVADQIEARVVQAELLAACKVAFDQTCSVGRPKDWEQLRAAIAKAEVQS
jgi:cobalamin synthase